MAKKETSTKDKIVLKAIELFAKNGFHATTFQQIADAVGITQPGVFVHYKNKQVLFSAIREKVALLNREYVDGLVDIKDDARTALQKHCEGNLIWVIQNRQYWQISVLLYYFACHDDEMRKLNQKALLGGEDRVSKYIYAGMRENKFMTKNPLAMTRQIHSFLIGQGIKYISFDPSPTKSDISKDVSFFLNSIFS